MSVSESFRGVTKTGFPENFHGRAVIGQKIWGIIANVKEVMLFLLYSHCKCFTAVIIPGGGFADHAVSA